MRFTVSLISILLALTCTTASAQMLHEPRLSESQDAALSDAAIAESVGEIAYLNAGDVAATDGVLLPWALFSELISEGDMVPLLEMDVTELERDADRLSRKLAVSGTFLQIALPLFAGCVGYVVNDVISQ